MINADACCSRLSMESRNQAFQELKPLCVKLSQAALGLMGKDGKVSDVVNGLEQVSQALKSPMVSTSLDEKLAQYVFFPISHVLRQVEKLTIRAQELTLECISILLTTAWKSNMPPELGIQLLILLSFLSDNPKTPKMDSEELQVLIFKCIQLVLEAMNNTSQGRSALVATSNVPHIGKALSVILDGCLDGANAEVQLTSLAALKSFTKAWPDLDALSLSFFPGIISCLTKILNSKTSEKRSFKVLASAIDVLGTIIVLVLDDGRTKNLPNKDDADAKGKVDKSWLKATAAQVKVALASVMKLRLHDRLIVREELAKFCTECIQKCWESLEESRQMLSETLVAMAAFDDSADRDLRYIITIRQNIAEELRMSLYNWIISLPRIMQSADDSAKQRHIQQIAVTFRVLSEERVDMSNIYNIFASNLRDGVISALSLSKKRAEITEFEVESTKMELDSLPQTKSTTFEEVIATRGSEARTISELANLVKSVTRNENSINLADDLVVCLQSTNHDMRLASFWLSLNVIRNSFDQHVDSHEFLDIDIDDRSMREDSLEQLYSFSVSLLSNDSYDDGTDWRLQALGLETIALMAGQHKQAFRSELIDVLYPVIQLVGSANPRLRQHAMACLNVMAEKCEYISAGELIISNVDYLVNAVGLKLNTFDLSPQAPRVLLMMVKLAGPSLLPYLDDVVDSIFVALESFHGYPKLVGLLFSVLKSIAEEGAKSRLVAIKGDEAIPSMSPASERNLRITSIESALREVAKFRKPDPAETLRNTKGIWNDGQGHPRSQIRKTELLDRERAEIHELLAEDLGDTDPEPLGSYTDENSAAQSTPEPKTYTLVHKITQLTQHYLTSASLELRIDLLSLIKEVFPALARREESFLPLINTLWPAIRPRLGDSEAYAVAGALDAVASMCANAGDFMKTRIEEAWPEILGLHKRCRNRSSSNFLFSDRDHPSDFIRADTSQVPYARQAVGSPYFSESPSRIVWNSLMACITGIADNVPVNDEIFDEVLLVLLPMTVTTPEVVNILNKRNPDAFWLASHRFGHERDHGIDQEARTLMGSPGPAFRASRKFVRVAR